MISDEPITDQLRCTLMSIERTPPALHFQALRHEYYNDAALVQAVARWERHETEALWLDEGETTVALGGLPPSLPGHMRGKPIFQCFLERLADGAPLTAVLPTAIYQDAHCLVFSPAGFRGDAEADAALLEGCEGDVQLLADRLTKTPLTMNPTSLNLGSHAALMSHAHLLVIPRKRIYNAVTLTEADATLIRHLEAVGRAAVRALLHADGRTAAKTVEPLADVPSTLPELAAVSYLPGGLGLSSSCARLAAQRIATTFHVYPQQSIGWLHMHAFCSGVLTRAFDHMDDKARLKLVGGSSGFPKNIPSSIVASMLEGKPAQMPSIPVDVHDVLRAIKAASIVQQVWRTYLEAKRSGKCGLSKESLHASLRDKPHLRDIPRASTERALQRSWVEDPFMFGVSGAVLGTLSDVATGATSKVNEIFH